MRIALQRCDDGLRVRAQLMPPARRDHLFRLTRTIHRHAHPRRNPAAAVMDQLGYHGQAADHPALGQPEVGQVLQVQQVP